MARRTWSPWRLLPFLCVSCSWWAYRNEELKGAKAEKASRSDRPDASDPPAIAAVRRASFELGEPRGNPDVVVCLALSGGGTRAAWFGASVMFELEDVALGGGDDRLDLMHEVDLISSVSGGSLAAAYYCISRDREPNVKLTASTIGALGGELADRVRFDEKSRRLYARDELSPELRSQLRERLAQDDRAKVDPLAQRAAPVVSRRKWDRDVVRELLTRNYTRRWMLNCLWPTNIVRYWTTAFDRGDVMAQTFADNLFDRKGVTIPGHDLTFADLNPERPNLILNATDATDDHGLGGDDHDSPEDGSGSRYGNVFTFTDDEFRRDLKSDLSTYPIAHAVMASASFPAVFPYRTLRDFREKEPRYVHVFDGGNADNLGLLSVKRAIRDHETRLRDRRDKPVYVVICVDAYTEPRGADPDDCDPRSPIDYLVDTNFLDSIDMLLKLNRFHVLSEFMSDEQQVALSARFKADVNRRQEKAPHFDAVQQKQEHFEVQEQHRPRRTRGVGDPNWEPHDLGERLLFWHLTFRDLLATDRKLWHRLESIPTDFTIDDEQADDLAQAATLLVNRDRETVDRIAKVVRGGKP